MARTSLPSPFKRTNRKALRYGLPAVALAAGVAFVLWPSSPTPPAAPLVDDPTRFGPERTLQLTRCAWVPSKAGGELRIDGTTNLPARASIRLDVRARGQVLLTEVARVDRGRFALRTPARGSVLPGSYVVTATFLLEEQERSLQEELHYQPRRLTIQLPLQVTGSSARDSGVRRRLLALFQAVNAQPRDKDELARLDQEALALSRELWIADQKAALRKLRLAIEVAGRPTFQRRSFEKLLLEAHVLAGL